jgi:hypothetical protein
MACWANWQSKWMHLQLPGSRLELQQWRTCLAHIPHQDGNRHMHPVDNAACHSRAHPEKEKIYSTLAGDLQLPNSRAEPQTGTVISLLCVLVLSPLSSNKYLSLCHAMRKQEMLQMWWIFLLQGIIILFCCWDSHFLWHHPHHTVSRMLPVACMAFTNC